MAAPMNEARFWALIAEARALAGATGVVAEADEIVEYCVDLLIDLSPKEIVAFEHRLQLYFQEAYRWDLWGVAYLVNGGCSDDGFDYALGWLIAQGRVHFHAAMKDPEAMADGLPEGSEMECPSIWAASAEAWNHVTGDRESFYEQAPNVERTILGEPWVDADLEKRFPRTYAKFAQV
ncbi:MAG: hypothetical protein AUK47_02605 [Deltaproteobacteria bacterium CG2_30_63_29]|nr:MAG: hypothetical protein AUK47_02605 [Deltaproteobacteria bacterium CG2_30_63_29]